MAGLQGKGQFSRGDVSFGGCSYDLEEQVKEEAGNGVITLLSTKVMPPYPQKTLGYLLELDDGTRLGCELLDDLDKQRKGPGPTRRYRVRCWPKRPD